MVALMPTRRTNPRFAHFALGCGLGASLGLIAYVLMRRAIIAARARSHREVRDSR